MSDLNIELISETFATLAGNGDTDGIKYYADSLAGNNALSEPESKCIRAIALTSFIAAARINALNGAREVLSMMRAYDTVKQTKQ